MGALVTSETGAGAVFFTGVAIPEHSAGLGVDDAQLNTGERRPARCTAELDRIFGHAERRVAADLRKAVWRDDDRTRKDPLRVLDQICRRGV